MSCYETPPQLGFQLILPLRAAAAGKSSPKIQPDVSSNPPSPPQLHHPLLRHKPHPPLDQGPPARAGRLRHFPCCREGTERYENVAGRVGADAYFNLVGPLTVQPGTPDGKKALPFSQEVFKLGNMVKSFEGKKTADVAGAGGEGRSCLARTDGEKFWPSPVHKTQMAAGIQGGAGIQVQVRSAQGPAR